MGNVRAPQERVSDPASIEVLEKAGRDGAETVFDRADLQGALCRHGVMGVCCRNCYMGPCQITRRTPRGICGAGEDTIVARNYLREVAAGTAAHSDHARHLALLLKKAAAGAGDYRIRDEAALREHAKRYGVLVDGRPAAQVAGELADRLLAEFTSQEEPLATLDLAPARRRALWAKQGLEPRGIDRMVVESLHRTTMGVDHDYRSILAHTFRTALADGWGGSHIATMAGDILFGTPVPVVSRANLGVLDAETVNVLVHGHEPALTEMLAAASRDPEVLEKAKAAGARSLTLAGICCTANEVLMRHGIPVAGNFLQQELAIVTGAVEMMITDVQCCMPSLPAVAAAYHTLVVSTGAAASAVGSARVSIDPDRAYEGAKGLLLRAIENFARRDPSKVSIPSHRRPLVAGFSVRAIEYMLGGTFRSSFRPLNDAVIAGRIRGVCGVVGCSHPRTTADAYTNALTRELVARNVLVLATGCAAIASAKCGMLAPAAALEYAGKGLKEVCEAVGMPPVLHMGSCVDNSRVLDAAARMIAEGGLGEDFSDLPVAGAAPEWMSEKAVAIGCYFVASGVDVVLGHPFHVGGSANVTKFLEEDARGMFGASFHVEPDPAGAAEKILALIEARRDRLGINVKAERKLYDMADRRAIHV